MTTFVGATVQYVGVRTRKCPKLAGFLGLVYDIISQTMRAIVENVRADRPVILIPQNAYLVTLLSYEGLQKGVASESIT